MIWVDGECVSHIPADDRGLSYGDGVFRTLSIRSGRVQQWSLHYAKLVHDCSALHIAPPNAQLLTAELEQIATQIPDCAVRVTVTRGSGGRGYAVAPDLKSRRIVRVDPLPEYPAQWFSFGVQLHLCHLRLGHQPQLAGIKHLNRLESVLARAEWTDPEVAEGLMCDQSGYVIEGTRSNVFIVEEDAIITPDLSLCGVAGVTRDRVILACKNAGLICRVEPISLKRFRAAREIFLVNSLIGVWPVRQMQHHFWSHFERSRIISQWLEVTI